MFVNFRFLYLFSAFLLLNGCAALKKREDVPKPLAEVNLSPEKLGFEKGEWPAADWWTLFNDDQLAHFIEIAIKENPNLQASISRVQEAYAQSKKTRSDLFPHLGAFFKDNYKHLSRDSLDRFPPSQVPAVINQVFLGLDFEYEIDLFGKNRERFRASLGLARATKAEMSQSLLMITASVAEAYFNMESNLLQLEIALEEVKRREAMLELIEKRMQHGLDDQLTLKEARAELLGANEKVTSLENSVEINRDELKALMGMSPDDTVDFALPQARVSRTLSIPENLPIDLVSRRADLMTKIWEVEAAGHLIGAAKAAFFPNINLAALLGFETLSNNTLFNAKSFAAALTPAVHLPIFKGGQLVGELQEQQANYDARVHEYNALLLQAAKEVSNGLKSVRSLEIEHGLHHERLTQKEEKRALSEARYLHGLDNYLEVLRSDLEVLEERASSVAIERGRLLATLALIRAMGGGYNSSKETPVNE